MLDTVREPFRSNTILVFDSDNLSRSSITSTLSVDGFDTVDVTDQHEFFNTIQSKEPCLLILNWDNQNLSGASFMRAIRENEEFYDIPTIVVTECCDSKARIESLESGADDCMSKPLSPHELILRVNSLLRRACNFSGQDNQSTSLKVKGMELDTSSLTFRVNGSEYYLNASDFRLLHQLMSKKGGIVTRQDLLDASHNANSDLDERSIDVYIMRLRKVLRQSGQDHLIQTVRGIGYRLLV